jgi:hypothetical protein
MKSRNLVVIGLSVLSLALASAMASAKEMTAFQLIEEGNKHVGESAKDRVVQIRSERSVGGIEPTVWYMVYYDPTATLKATEVKFGGGKMMHVKRPLRLLEPVTGQNTPLDRDKLKVDSDEAIKIAISQPILEKVEVKSVEMRLGRSEFGGFEGQPVWRVKLWAAKEDRRRSRQVDIGEVVIQAEDGTVLKSDLHISRVL